MGLSIPDADNKVFQVQTEPGTHFLHTEGTETRKAEPPRLERDFADFSSWFRNYGSGPETVLV